MIPFLFFSVILNVAHGQSDDICLSLRRGPEVAYQPQGELRGVPGKAGAPGITGQKGSRGDPGLAGTCTCDTEEIIRSMLRRSCVGGMIWNKTCVYLPYTSGERVDYDEAVRVCNSSKGELLKITDDKMYDVVYDYLNRTSVDSGTNLDFWLGMTFQPVNNPRHLITITPEWKITLNRWWPGCPHTGSIWSTYVNMGMKVILREESIYKGIYNTRPSATRTPLCQYQL